MNVSEKAYSLTLQMPDGREGITFSIYKVADMSEGVNYTLTEEFKPYADTVDWTSLTTYAQWASLAETLKNAALHDGLVPVSVKTDADGKAGFTGLERGLYLVTGESLIVELEKYDLKYRFTPSMITLPMQDAVDSSKWIIDAEIQPKGSVDTVLPEMLDQLKVIKLWEDEDDLHQKRPASVTVDLMKNGKVEETVTLSKENNWEYVWRELDGRYAWSVIENNISDGWVHKRKSEEE